MRLALVVNPRSGSAPDQAELERLLAADGARVSTTTIEELHDDPCSLPEHAVAPAARQLRNGGAPDRIVVASGDGTIGQCARFAQELGVPLAIVPGGTANDFARAHGLPLDVEEAIGLARDPAAATIRSDLAQAGRRPFVNAAAAGLSVIAAQEAAAHKSRLGSLAYAVGALKSGLAASPRSCRVVCDGEERYAGDVWQVVVGVTGAFGGGSEIGGTCAGQLDVAIVPAGSRAGLIRRAYGMRAGRLTAQDDVPHLRGTVVDIELEGEMEFNVDGELCRCDPAHFVLRPDSFEVVSP